MQPTHITLHFQISKFKQPITLQLRIPIILTDSHNPINLKTYKNHLPTFSYPFGLHLLHWGSVPISLMSANYHL